MGETVTADLQGQEQVFEEACFSSSGRVRRTPTDARALLTRKTQEIQSIHCATMYACTGMQNRPMAIYCIYSTCTAFPELRDPSIGKIGMPGHAALRRVSSVLFPLACHLSLYKMSHGPCCVCTDTFRPAQYACGA